jgi:hypothetical protein
VKPKSTTVRGYGYRHQLRRKRWASRVATGLVECARCSLPIAPGEPWDLGHVDGDKSRYAGPEHRYCNRSSAAARGNRARARRVSVDLRTSRLW